MTDTTQEIKDIVAELNAIPATEDIQNAENWNKKAAQDGEKDDKKDDNAAPSLRTTEKEGEEPTRVIMSAAKFCEKRKNIQWLIKGYVQKNALMMIYGKSGAYKSFIALDQALSVAAGLTDWNGAKVTSGTVLYLTGEGETGLQKRIAAWAQDRGVLLDDIPFYVGSFTLDMNANEGALVKAVKAFNIKPDWIILDTLIHYLNGDENKAQDARDLIIGCNNVCAVFGCSVTLVHHVGVGEDAQHRARGSSAFIGAMDIQTEIEAQQVDGGRRRVIMTQRKNKDADLMPEMTFAPQVVELNDWKDEDGEPVKSIVLNVENEKQSKRVRTVPEKLEYLVKAWRDACESGEGTCSSVGEFKGLKHTDWQARYCDAENGYTVATTEKAAKYEFNAGVTELLRNGNIEIDNPNDKKTNHLYVLIGTHEKDHFPQYAEAARKRAATTKEAGSDTTRQGTTGNGDSQRLFRPQRRKL